MWYFSWILGLGLACAFAILNAMWFELDADKSASVARPTRRISPDSESAIEPTPYMMHLGRP